MSYRVGFQAVRRDLAQESSLLDRQSTRGNSVKSSIRRTPNPDDPSGGPSASASINADGFRVRGSAVPGSANIRSRNFRNASR